MRYLLASLLIHGLLFAFSGTTFIQRPQYSAQPSAQMVEVSIEEIKIDRHSEGARSATEEFKGTLRSFASLRMTKILHPKSDVRVKANPDYFQNPSPEYPDLAKQMRQEGLVMLAVDVDRQGFPIKVEIKQSSGYRLLDQAALKAVRYWKFQPGNIGNIPVESTVTMSIRFRLEK